MAGKSEREWANHKWVARKRNDDGKWIYDYGNGFSNTIDQIGQQMQARSASVRPISSGHVVAPGRRSSFGGSTSRDYRQAVVTPHGTNMVGAVAGLGAPPSGHSSNYSTATKQILPAAGGGVQAGTWNTAVKAQSATKQILPADEGGDRTGKWNTAVKAVSSGDSSKSKASQKSFVSTMTKVSNIPKSSSAAKSVMSRCSTMKLKDL